MGRICNEDDDDDDENLKTSTGLPFFADDCNVKRPTFTFVRERQMILDGRWEFNSREIRQQFDKVDEME